MTRSRSAVLIASFAFSIASLCAIGKVHAQSSTAIQSGTSASEAANNSQSPEGETRIEHYLHFAHPVATVPLEFPGPNGGYTVLRVPVQDVTPNGDTIIRQRSFVLDMNMAHDGTFIAPDTMTAIKDMLPFNFVFPNGHTIHTKMAPGHKYEEFKKYDSLFMGALGYGLLKQFVTAFDFRKNTVTFYPLYSNISIADKDEHALQLPIIDDAHITYCHCPFSTIWLEVEAPPLKPGRVELAFQEPMSQIFTSAVDPHTRMVLDREAKPDSTGQKQKVGLTLAQFRVGGENLAGRSPRRIVDELPPEFHDLSVEVIGTLGTDVLRTFSGLILDPSRQKMIFVK